jgi:hypothetical protein
VQNTVVGADLDEEPVPLAEKCLGDPLVLPRRRLRMPSDLRGIRFHLALLPILMRDRIPDSPPAAIGLDARKGLHTGGWVHTVVRLREPLAVDLAHHIQPAVAREQPKARWPLPFKFTE